MRDHSLPLIHKVINEWQNNNLGYIKKVVTPYNHPNVEGEFHLVFTMTVDCFYCEKEQMVITDSTNFQTHTLSNDPLSDNPDSDWTSLKKELKKLDEDFETLLHERLANCDKKILTSNPLFFN